MNGDEKNFYLTPSGDNLVIGTGQESDASTVSSHILKINSSSVSGSFTGSFAGDGGGITGVTAEWDGAHVGDASVTGSLYVTQVISGSALTGSSVEATQITGSIISASNFYGDGSGLTGIPDLTGSWDVNGSSIYYNDGSVGIGIEDPQVLLDVDGSNVGSKSLQLRSGDASDGTDSAQVLFTYNGSPYNSAGYAHSIRTRHNGGAEAGNAIDFWVWDQATDTSSTMGTKRVMTLDGNGRVGIGNATPGYDLEVYTNGSKAEICIHEDSGDYNSELQLRCGANDWHIRNHATNDDLEFQNESAIRMTLTNGGELYLPDMTSVAGTNYMRYHTTTGLVTYIVSTKATKTNIKNLKKSDGTNVINQLRPIRFESKNERGNIRTGFVAEEVAAVDASLVSYGLDYKHHKTTGEILTGSDGKKIIKSDKLVPQMWEFEAVIAHLVKASQQQHTIIEELKNEIDDLKKGETS